MAFMVDVPADVGTVPAIEGFTLPGPGVMARSIEIAYGMD